MLDNFEHVVAAAASVADLLVSCPHLKILVTSRAPLHLRGEHESPVPPLTLADPRQLPSPDQLLQSEAIRLFVARARAVKSDFALSSQNAATVAIELAAARIKVLSPADILSRLGDRFRILTGEAVDLPVRQQTLWNTLAWSYDLLQEGEQQLFTRQSAFTGGRTLDAAEAVSGLTIDLLNGLTSLMNQSLLHRDEIRGEARFAMLETVREYGRSLLVASREENASLDRHAGYFLALVEDCERQYTNAGPDSLTWDSRLEPKQANLRAAVAWFRDHDPALGLRLAAGLAWHWVWHGDLAEGEEWLTAFLAQTPGEPKVRGRALLGPGTLKRDRGDLAGAQPLFAESMALCRQVGDRWGFAESLSMLALQARSAGDYERATALMEESLAIVRESGVQASLLQNLTCLGQIHRLLALLGRVTLKQGDPTRARRLFEESRALASQNGHLSHACQALYRLAVLDWGDNDAVGGHARLAEGLRLAQQGADRQTLAFGLLLGANHASENGVFVRAIRLYGAADMVLPGYGFEVVTFERAPYQRSLDAARAALAQDAFAAAWAEGHALTSEQAIALALEVSGG